MLKVLIQVLRVTRELKVQLVLRVLKGLILGHKVSQVQRVHKER